MNRRNQGFISYTEGHLAEKEAISFMQKKGYKLFDSNIHAPKGVGANEIDLIFTKEDTIIFIEVKKRKQKKFQMEVWKKSQTVKTKPMTLNQKKKMLLLLKQKNKNF